MTRKFVDARSDGYQEACNEYREDALRWRALMSSERMHWMGGSGFSVGDIAGQVYMKPKNDPKNYVHFGIEFYDTFDYEGKERDDKFARDCLTSYADLLKGRLERNEAS